MKTATKEDIINHVKILDIAQEFNIGLEKVYGSNFDYKCKCPSLNHKNGSERTSSCYINSKDNNFFCFGCNLSKSSIDFFMACKDIDFGEAIKILRDRVPDNLRGKKQEIEINNFYSLLEISKLLRKTMLEHPEDLKFLNKIMMKVDEYTLDLESTDDAIPKKIYKELESKFKKRYS